MHCIKLLVTNRKGGVGKSTIATNLAAFLAIQDSTPVSLIDFDQQSSSSKWVEKAPDVGLKIANPQINFQQTGQLALAEAKRSLNLYSKQSTISVSDLTWTDAIPSEYMLEYDILLIPSATSKFEMASSEIFILEYIQKNLPEIRARQQTILVIPSRVDKSFNPEQKFLNLSQIEDCAITPPIHFIPAMDDFVYEDFLCVSTNDEIAQNFSSFGHYVAELIRQKIKLKQDMQTVKHLKNQSSLTILDKFRQARQEEKESSQKTSHWIPEFLVKK